MGETVGSISLRLTLPKLRLAAFKLIEKLMSLGTGALKVSGEGPEESKHCREASLATWQARTTHLLRAWRLEVPDGRATRNLRIPPKRLQEPPSPLAGYQTRLRQKRRTGLPVSGGMRALVTDTQLATLS